MLGRLIVLAAALFFSACASLNYEDYRQVVLVTSDPPGAKVYQGSHFLGVTPSYMKVRRGRTPRLNFVPPDGDSHEVKLNTEYRWNDSGALNLLLVPLAPAGWLVDYATGTSWNIKDPAVQKFGKGGGWPATREPKVVAIAPPTAEDPRSPMAWALQSTTRLRYKRESTGCSNTKKPRRYFSTIRRQAVHRPIKMIAIV